MNKCAKEQKSNMKAVDFESPKPLYVQMKEILKERFLSGGSDISILPTEVTLASEYKVGRMVVQRAIRQLCKDGYLYRRPKLGTFISRRKKETLRVAYYEYSRPSYSTERIFSLFEKKYPDIAIEGIKLIPSNEYSTNIVKLIADNDVDIIKVSELLFREFEAPNLFYPLNDHIKRYKAATYPEPWNALKSANTYYGFPLGFSPVVMAYNKDLFRKAGITYPENDWTWDDFLDKAKMLTNSNQYGFLFSPSINRWPAFIFQNGKKILLDDKNIFGLAAAESREAINFICELIHKLKLSPVYMAPMESPHELFSRLKIAMTMTSYFEFNKLRKIRNFSWDIAPLPRKKCPATLLLINGFVISRNTRNFNLALEFLKFTQSEIVQKYIKSCGTVIPIDRKIAEQSCKHVPPSYNIYKEIMPYAQLLNLPLFGPRAEIIKEETDLLWHGLQNYDETCQHIKNRLKKMKNHRGY